MSLNTNILNNVLQELETIGLKFLNVVEHEEYSRYFFEHRNFSVSMDIVDDASHIVHIWNVIVGEKLLNFECISSENAIPTYGTIVVQSFQDFVSMLNKELFLLDGIT